MADSGRLYCRMNNAYLIPSHYGEAEFTEKRSRFTGRVWPIQSEEEAMRHLKEMRETYWDATHNVYAYILRENGIMRYSDDGEPQGTSGQPTLNVFRSAEIQNVCCIVTRYFGGILLGTGGLVRAYSRAAKEALTAAGVSKVGLWDRVLTACPYSLYERVRREFEAAGAILEPPEFGADVSIEALLPTGTLTELQKSISELSAGSVELLEMGSEYRAVPMPDRING